MSALRCVFAVPLLLSLPGAPIGSALHAQVAPGSAVVASKIAGTGPTVLQLVDPAGAVSTITGLDPATAGSSKFDGARALLVDDGGLLFAGLAVDNSAGTLPLPLNVRLLVLSGPVAGDVPFATLMQVPPGEIWTVADMKQRADGSLLVVATQVLLQPNPQPNKAVFVVVGGGASVQVVPITGMAIGTPLAIADAGDRFVIAIEQSFFARNCVLQSLAFSGAVAPFQVALLVGFGSFGGLDLDTDGRLVFGGRFSGSTATLHRVAHAPGATVVDVPGGPAGFGAASVNPASGVLSTVTFTGDLARSDTVLGGTQPWTTGLAMEVIALSVGAGPQRYALPIPPNQIPVLGSQGGVPSLPNAAFALRIREPAGQPGAAFFFGGVARASVNTPFGLLVVDPASGITVLGFAPVPAGAPGVFPLPLPGNPGLRGLAFDLQSLLVPTVGPAAMSNGLELVLL